MNDLPGILLSALFVLACVTVILYVGAGRVRR